MLVIVTTLLFQPQSHISTEWPGDTVNEDKQGRLCRACVEELQHNWHCFFLPQPLQFHISVWLRPSVVCKYRMWHSALIQAQPRLTHRAGSGAERQRYVLLWVLSMCHRAPPRPLLTLPAEDESWLGLPQGEEAPGSCRKPGVSAEEVEGGSRAAGTPGWPWCRRCRSRRDPARQPCQHWWLQRVPLRAHLARRDTGRGTGAVTVSEGITVSYLHLQGGQRDGGVRWGVARGALSINMFGHTHAVAITSRSSLPTWTKWILTAEQQRSALKQNTFCFSQTATSCVAV